MNLSKRKMGTAGGEPRVLLNALKPMLGVVGDIKTPQEVMRVVGMMKDAEKLMSRCVYLNILKATCRQAKQSEEKRDTLEKFLSTGGWGILNKWLLEFTKSENFPVLLELIDVLKILPITVELLKQGNTGKLIKQMTKLDHADVKKNAGSLIKKWKDMIRGGDEAPLSKRNREVEAKGPPEKRAKKLDGLVKGVSDSAGFMSALTAATPAPIKKKRRNSNSKATTLPLDEILYKAKHEKKLKLEADHENLSLTETEEAEEPMDTSLALLPVSPAVEAANLALAKTSENDIVIDEGSLARKKNKKKRNITWAADDQLVQVSYFELLEGERKGHHAENFSEARHHESLLEKQAMRAARRGQDKMSERVMWGRLIPVDNAGVQNFTPGEKSREKFIQAEREKTVLAFIFLTKESLPSNPSEPDFDPEDHSNRTQPRVIPHDEDGAAFPPAKSTNQQTSQKVQPLISEEDFNFAKSSTKNPPLQQNPTQQHKGSILDVSPAVQSIMSQLMRTNNPPVSTNEQGNKSSMPNINSGLLGQNGMISNNGPPPPPNHPASKSPAMNNNLINQDSIPSIMQNPIPNPRGRGGPGPRFNGGGRGGPIMNRGAFNPRMGGQQPRWDGPPPQGPGYNDDWNNFNDDHYNDGFNNNFHTGQNNRGGGNFGPPPHSNNDFNDFGNGGGRGFRRGGNRGRGNRGGNFDRNRGGNDWNYDDRREDWGRDDRNFGPGPNRGRGGRNRDDREKAVCQHFLSQRGCRNGDRCNFLHMRR